MTFCSKTVHIRLQGIHFIFGNLINHYFVFLRMTVRSKWMHNQSVCPLVTVGCFCCSTTQPVQLFLVVLSHTMSIHPQRPLQPTERSTPHPHQGKVSVQGHHHSGESAGRGLLRKGEFINGASTTRLVHSEAYLLMFTSVARDLSLKLLGQLTCESVHSLTFMVYRQLHFCSFVAEFCD